MKRQQRINERQTVVKSSSGKVKKGSGFQLIFYLSLRFLGFRYDKKKGYDRYFSSSEEETETEEEDEDYENDGCEDLFNPQFSSTSFSVYSF